MSSLRHRIQDVECDAPDNQPRSGRNAVGKVSHEASRSSTILPHHGSGRETCRSPHLAGTRRRRSSCRSANLPSQRLLQVSIMLQNNAYYTLF